MRLFNCPKLSERYVGFVGTTGGEIWFELPTIIGVRAGIGRGVANGVGEGKALVITTLEGVGTTVGVAIGVGVGFAPTTITRWRVGVGLI